MCKKNRTFSIYIDDIILLAAPGNLPKPQFYSRLVNVE